MAGGGDGRSPLVQKPVNRLGWWKGKFALFQTPATEGEGGGHCPRASSRPDKQGMRAFIDITGWGAPCRNSTVISNSHLRFVVSCLTSIILVVLGSINFKFWDALVSIFFCGQLLEPVAACVLGTVWSSCI